MLIPLGLKDGQLLDVSEVPRGRACGCICPSCHQVLIAKKGDSEKMAHHFAHDKKANKDQQEQIECQYSFFVAARLVIKQCFRALTTFEMTFPKWQLSLSETDIFGREICVSGDVTHPRTLTITDFEVEPDAPYSELDILCNVQEYPLGFHFSYPGRPVCPSPEYFTLSILNIDLAPLQEQYQTKLMEGAISFKKIVMEYVLKGEYKLWISHARQADREVELTRQLHAKLDEANNNPPSTSLSPKISHNLCIKCNRNRANYVDGLICSTCLEHYYDRGIFRMANIKKAVLKDHLL